MTLDPQLKNIILSLTDAIGKRSDLIGLDSTTIVDAITDASRITFPLGGQFLLDPNEINGWGGGGGIYKDSYTLDLGNVGTTNLSRSSGGLTFPFDIKIIKLFSWHRNSASAAKAWGWILARQAKTANSNSRTTSYILDEVADNGGVGPRNYGNNRNQLTDIDISSLPNNILPAGDTLILGVASPTATTTNRYVRVESGYLLFERI